MRRHQNREEYIDSFPHLRRWINECARCHARGYAPDMPSHVGGARFNVCAENIKRLFPPLALNAEGLCEYCARALTPK